MRTNTARKIDTAKHEPMQAEIFQLRQLKVPAGQDSAAPDFEAFLAQYGEGIASDFA